MTLQGDTPSSESVPSRWTMTSEVLCLGDGIGVFC